MITNNMEFNYVETPYKRSKWQRSKHFSPASNNNFPQSWSVPPELKHVLAIGFDDAACNNMLKDRKEHNGIRDQWSSVRDVLTKGPTKDNHSMFFHYLLWWEETKTRSNMKNYNMSNVPIIRSYNIYKLTVPGLSEKRPSLIPGDRVYIQPCQNSDYCFESIIKSIKDDMVDLMRLDSSFQFFHEDGAKFNIRFIPSRVPIERMHIAVDMLPETKNMKRIFPAPVKEKPNKLVPIPRYYNRAIASNEEQVRGVRHILSRSSGRLPYMVFGPPGTGKTATIAEAIIQVVKQDSKHRVLVCTGSNMAADHIALALLKYENEVNVDNFIKRPSSKFRSWGTLPKELYKISNGYSLETYEPVYNEELLRYRVAVMTLSHSFKYGTDRAKRDAELQISHLFIDEAAEACEPSCLIPITGLLKDNGLLVLAGDPEQLGPVCICRGAGTMGLGKSLMERLILDYPEIYKRTNYSYITFLVKNYRSDSKILDIPNELVYDGALVPCAKEDPISKVNILDKTKPDEAIVFHGVNSVEQNLGCPSFYNEVEIKTIWRYISALLYDHMISPREIGVVTPYMRQVIRLKNILRACNIDNIEVGTVEAFQGKEKRIILVSTVRSNKNLVNVDLRHNLGFIGEKKRFNVMLTRAKAKLIIIGNPDCLQCDEKWSKYMEKCKEYNTYIGYISKPNK